MRRFVVTFLTREGCHLCEDALPLVGREVGRAGASLMVVDVDGDPSLAAEYGRRVPVVLGPERTVLAEGAIGRRRLRRALRSLG